MSNYPTYRGITRYKNPLEAWYSLQEAYLEETVAFTVLKPGDYLEDMEAILQFFPHVDREHHRHEYQGTNGIHITTLFFPIATLADVFHVLMGENIKSYTMNPITVIISNIEGEQHL